MAVAVLSANGFAQESSKKPADNSSIAEVVAEGAGTTPDEALKDAFRNAVRQVVGAVVDAESLVKNDEIIDDQVLAYSNGFVKKYDEIAGSKKSSGGVHRIKIKAQVERRRLIAKLRESKVAVKDVDGKSLFAEAVTTAEAEQNATNLLAKIFGDLPNLLTATVVGKPDYDRDKSELVFNVDVAVDPKAYRDFATRLRETLHKISQSKGTVFVKGGILNGQAGTAKNTAPGYEVAPIPPILLGPNISKDNPHAWCLWVCASPPGTNGAMTWHGFVVDADVHEAVLPYMNRRYARVSDSNEEMRVLPWLHKFPDLGIRSKQTNISNNFGTVLRTSLADSEGNAVGEDVLEFALGLNGDVSPGKSGSARFPWVLYVIPRDRSAPSLSPTSEKAVLNAYVAPMGFQLSLNNHNRSDFFQITYAEKQSYQRRIKLSLEQLKAVEEVKSRVVYLPEMPASK